MPSRRADRAAPSTRLAAILTLCLGFGTAGLAAEWGRYVNGRFGTAVELPRHLFSDTPVHSANGDGATFRAGDGAVLRVWGARHVADFSLSDLADMALDGPAAYRRVMTDGYAVSSKRGGIITYQRCRLSRSGLLHCLRVEYPEARKSAYDPVIARMSGALSGP